MVKVLSEAELRRHVNEATSSVAEQRARIELMRARGENTALAKRLLRIFERTLDLHSQYLARRLQNDAPVELGE